MDKKQKFTPWGIRIIAIIFFFYSLIFIFLSIPSIIYILGGASLILLMISILFLFIGHRLWKGKNWARIAAIIVSLIVCISGIIEIIINPFDWIKKIIPILIHLSIIPYLLFNKEVKEFFKKNKEKKPRLDKEEKEVLKKLIKKIEHTK